MPQTSLRALRDLLCGTARRWSASAATDALRDADRVGWDQGSARRQVQSVLATETRAERAAVLAAVRHELCLPLGPTAVPPGALHLVRADDSSIVIGSSLRSGSTFLGELVVRDGGEGSIAEYAVAAWHERDGVIHGQRQLQHVRAVIVRAVRIIDPLARISESNGSGEM